MVRSLLSVFALSMSACDNPTDTRTADTPTADTPSPRIGRPTPTGPALPSWWGREAASSDDPVPPWHPDFEVPYDPPDPAKPGWVTSGGVPVISITCEYLFVVDGFAGGPPVAYCAWAVTGTDTLCMVAYGGTSTTCLPTTFDD